MTDVRCECAVPGCLCLLHDVPGSRGDADDPDTRGMFDDAESIEQAIYWAVAAASMCWENPSGDGVFDATRAKSVASELYQYVQLRWSLAEGRSLTPRRTPNAPRG